MKMLTLSQADIHNPVYAKLKSLPGASPELTDAPTTLAHGDLLVIDCASCPVEEISQAFAPLDAGACVLLLNPGQAAKQALGKHIGFRSHGTGRSYLVAKRAANGRNRWFIWEDREAAAQTTQQSGSIERLADGTQVVSSSPRVFKSAPQTYTTEQVDAFVQTVVNALTGPMMLASGLPSGLVTAAWTYSASHPFTVGSSSSEVGLGPPPSHSGSLQLTYEYDAALNNADLAGAFQWVGCQMSGILSNGGLAGNSGTSFGWVLAYFNPSLSAPAELLYYSSSPLNSNGETTVTTDSSVNVGFSTGGASANYNYSNSISKNIAGWEVVQLTGTAWNYYQNTPYNGNSTDNGTIDNCLDWAHGNGVQTDEFPAISTSSLQFAVNTVWKTNSVLTDEITVGGATSTMLDYIMTQLIMGATNKEASWLCWYNFADTFSLDLSKVS